MGMLLNGRVATSAGGGKESSTETATTKARSAPLPITCVQDNERVLCFATAELELSIAMPAQAADVVVSRARTKRARSVVKNPTACEPNETVVIGGIPVVGITIFFTDLLSLLASGLASASWPNTKARALLPEQHS